MAAHEWTTSEIEEALRSWHAAQGRLPTHTDWAIAADDHPAARTVLRRARWESWHGFLGEVLQLTPDEVRDQLRWEWKPGVWKHSRAEVLQSLRRSAAELGRPPVYDEWELTAPDRPTARWVVRSMGG